jgi:hypothetical protein
MRGIFIPDFKTKKMKKTFRVRGIFPYFGFGFSFTCVKLDLICVFVLLLFTTIFIYKA